MPKRRDLEAMHRNPGNVTSRDLRAAAEERGWVYRRTEGSHHIYRKGSRSVSVPETVANRGTIRGIIKTLRKGT